MWIYVISFPFFSHFLFYFWIRKSSSKLFISSLIRSFNQFIQILWVFFFWFFRPVAFLWSFGSQRRVQGSSFIREPSDSASCGLLQGGAGAMGEAGTAGRRGPFGSKVTLVLSSGGRFWFWFWWPHVTKQPVALQGQPGDPGGPGGPGPQGPRGAPVRDTG